MWGWEACLVPSSTSQRRSEHLLSPNFIDKIQILALKAADRKIPSAYFSVIRVAGLSPGRTSYPGTCQQTP